MQTTSPLGSLPLDIQNLNDARHVFLFSHGFGTNRFGRNDLLKNVGEKLIAQGSQVGAVWFDYIKVGSDKGISPTLSEQATMLHSVLGFIYAMAPGVNVTFIGHSLGSLAASAMLKTRETAKLTRAILLAPPAQSPYYRFTAQFQQHAGTHINHDGISRLVQPGSDPAFVTEAFWVELQAIVPYLEVKRLADECMFGVKVIRATQDLLWGMDVNPYYRLSDIGGVSVTGVSADHDFGSESAVSGIVSEVAGFMGW